MSMVFPNYHKHKRYSTSGYLKRNYVVNKYHNNETKTSNFKSD